MSSPSLSRLRAAFPEKTAQFSDDDLTMYLGDSRPDLLEQDQELGARYRELRPGNIPAALGTAVATGFGDRLPATGAGVLAAFARDAINRGGPELASALPLERIEQSALDYRQQQMGEAAQSWSDPAVRPITNVEQIRTEDGVIPFIRDLALVAGPGVIESIPSMAVSLGAGALASRFAPGAAGELAAAGLASVAQNLGDIYGDVASRPGVDRNRAIEAALPAGVAAGILDTAGLLLPASRLFPGLRASQIGELVSGVLGRGGLSGAVSNAVAGAPVEGLTEAMQEALAIAAEEQATGQPVSADEVRSRLLNAGVIGAAAGSAFSGATGFIPGGGETSAPQTMGSSSPDLTASSPDTAPAPAPNLAPLVEGLDLPAIGGDLSGGITAEEAAFQDLQSQAEAIRLGVLPGMGGSEDTFSLPQIDLAPPDFPAVAVIENANPVESLQGQEGEGLPPEEVANAPVPPATPVPAETVPPLAPPPEATAAEAPGVGASPLVAEPPPAVPAPADASTNTNTTIQPPPFRVAQFGTKALPDRVSTAAKPDPRGRAGRVGIVLEKDGKAYGRLAYKAGGELRVEGADFLPKAKGASVRLAELERAGYRVQWEPFQFDRPNPGFKVDATPAEFDAWMGQSQQDQATIREIIAEGAGDKVLEALLTRADPQAMQAVDLLQSMVTEASGADRSRVLQAFGQRIDSQARGGLRATNVLKKLADAELEATKLLRTERGKVLGRWTKAEWDILKAAAAAPEEFGAHRALRESGRPVGDTPVSTAEAAVLTPFRGRGETWGEARAKFAGWAASRADEGLRTQMGGDAYAGRGQAKGGARGGDGRAVEVSMDAAQVDNRPDIEAETAAAGVDASADASAVGEETDVDTTEDIPLSSGLENAKPAELRATLNAYDISDEQIDFVLDEVAEGDGSFEEVAEVAAYDPDIRKALEAVGDTAQIQNLIQSLHALVTQTRRREGGTEDTAGSVQPSGQSAGGPGALPGAAGQEEGQAPRLKKAELASVLPGGLGPVAAEPRADGTVRYAPKPPESVEALDFNIEEAAKERAIEDARKRIRNGERMVVQARLMRALDGEGSLAFAAQQSAAYLEARARERADARADRELVRGADWVRERLLRARRTGELGSGLVDFALWLVDKNPALVSDVALSIRTEGKGMFENAAGAYNPMERIVRLFTSRAREGTAVHEILHHSERLMPDEVRQGIIDAWAEALDRAIKDAASGPDAYRRLALGYLARMQTDAKASKEAAEAFRRGVLKPEDYALSNPSEFWAVNATRILADKRAAEAGGWVAEAKQWLREFVEQAKSWFGIKSDAAVLRGLRGVLDGTYQDTNRQASQMLSQEAAKFSQELFDYNPPPVGDVENPAVTVNQTMAALNAAIATEAELALVLAKQGKTLDWFRTEFGLADPQALKIRAQSLLAAGGQPISGVNAAQTFGDFAAQANAARARIMAYQAAEQRKTTLGKAVAEATREADSLRNRARRRLEAFNEAHRDYLNAEGLTALVQRGVRELLVRERRLTGRLGTQMGAVMQMLRELDARADELLDRDYAGVFAKLARNRDLSGRNLFDLLDTLVNQAGIDFKGRRVTEIRQAIADRYAANPDRTELALLLQNTSESRALLATVVAYAKTNEAVLLQIERRRERNAAERVRLQGALDALLADRKILDQAVRDLPKTAKLEERARAAYSRAKQELAAVNRKIEREEARAAAARAAIPVYQKALVDLGREFNLRPHVTFGDGMTYHVPASIDAGGEELRGGAKTLKLNSAGEVTNRAELDRDLEKMTRWLQYREATGAKDGDYFVVKAQRDELLAGGYFNGDLRKVDNLTSTLFLQPVGVQAASFGTASGRLIAQMMQRHTAVQGELKARGEKLGTAFEAKRDALREALLGGRAPEAKDLTNDRLYALFYDPVASLFEKERGLLELGLTNEEVRARLLQKAINQLAANPETAPYVRGREADVAPALRAFIKAAEEASAFYNDFNAKNGIGVKDARLIVETLDGKTTEGIRDALPQGAATFSRQLSRGLRLTYSAMQGAGWDTLRSEIGGLAALYEEGGADAVRDAVMPYFTEGVLQGFATPLATMETYSAFDAPAVAAGDLRPEASPALTAEAWARADGDVVAFAENLFELHGGDGGRAAYVQSVLQRMVDYYGQIKELQDPGANGVQLAGLEGMVRNVMIDARVLERWPTGWSEYIAFDRQTNHNLNTRVAAQVAFGRDTERLAGAFKTLEREVAQGLVEYRTWERQALTDGLSRGALPGLASEVDKAVRARFVEKYGAEKGRAEWKRLRDLAQREPLIRSMQESLRAFYSSRDGDLGATRLASAAGGALASGVLNQPGTALMQLTELFSPIIQAGVSGASLKQVLRNLKFLGEDLAGSFAQAMGLEMGQGSRLARKFAGMGLNDPLAARRLTDAVRDAERRGDQSGATTGLLRRIPQIQGVGITRFGEASRYTVLRPLAPFTAAAIATHRANTLSLWARVEDMVLRAAEHMQQNPATAADPAFEFTADTLGLKGLEAQSFETLRKKMAEGYDLPLARLAREAVEARADAANRDGLLSDKTRALLHGMALNEVTLEGNLANMNPRAFTSSALRLMLPLWGWPIRRAMQVAGLRMTPEGRATMEAVNRGLLALAVVSAGGLAFSVLVDEYHEEVLRKARNLRSARALPELLAKGELREAFLTFVEASNRVGTAGLFGEIANTALNTGQGGDNRGLSLDQRVLMMNSILGMYRATSNLIAQGEADYSGVVRPYLSALGGNGALQYMQLINSAADATGAGAVFGREEAFSRRLNAQNWLRVGGRSERLEVRAGAGGTATPTPLTPVMTRMALAAYADDRAGFARAWREALAVARAEGKDDPITYVRDAFAARHPLRTVFRTLSADDYGRLLRRLPAEGAADVRQAVGAYNRYLESIEGTAFTGSRREKPRLSP